MKRYCKRKHDTSVCGRTSWNACKSCVKIIAQSPLLREKVKIRKGKYKEAVKRFIEKLKSKACMDCKDKFNPWQMDFDHRPTEVKRFEINKFVNIGSLTSSKLELLYEEIAKCDLVCSNCHRDRTHRRLKCNLI